MFFVRDDQRAGRETREMYEALVENSADFVAICGLDGAVWYVNRAGRDLVGLPDLAAARSTPALDFLVAGARESVVHQVVRELIRGGTWSGSVPLRHQRTGQPILASHNVFMLTDSAGKRFAVATVSRDLREIRRVEDGLRLLSRTGAAVVDFLDYQRTLRSIARAFVEGFASYCLLDVMPRHGQWERTVEHRDPAFVPLLLELSRPSGDHPIARAIEHGETSVMQIDEHWAVELDDPLRGEAVRRLRVRSIISVPISLPDGEIVGALTCALDDTAMRPDYTAEDLEFVKEVARRAGAAIANLKLYDRERRIALELQSASLPPRLPRRDDVDFDAEYRPGGNEAKVGGDWYDAFTLDDGRLVFTVGDVVGHGLQAAVMMTKLRLAMQSAARVQADPTVMLRVADSTLRHADPDGFATAFAAVYDPQTRTLAHATAGHPAPLVRTADGTISELPGLGTQLGISTGEPHATEWTQIEPGSTLVMVTDGLIEITRDIDVGTERLHRTLERDDIVAARRPAQAIVDAVVGDDEPHDDIAVLVVRFL
jgi:PAS domain S-box-containing protein